MKRFVLHTAFFSFLFCAGCFLLILMADGSADESYLKLTTTKQNSLIVGSSRAGQGILPEILNDQLAKADFFNYAFSIRNTPYGEPYFRSINRKLNPLAENSRYLVCVNPWTISSITENPEDSLNFRELGSPIDNTRFVNIDPNIEYIVESYQQKNMNFILKKFRKGEYQTFFVHDDGWLEVVIESDMFSKTERTKNKINSYKEKLEKEYSGVSNFRLSYLKKTINLLKKHGEVYLIRLPVIDEMLDLENKLSPDFDNRMQEIADNSGVYYFNEMPNRTKYDYTDGHHLTIESSRKFSDYIAKKIKEIETGQLPNPEDQ